MNPEITDTEAQILKDYSDEFNKIVKKGTMNTELTSICMSWTTYFHALCVKYGQNPFDVQIDSKTKKWSPRTDIEIDTEKYANKRLRDGKKK